MAIRQMTIRRTRVQGLALMELILVIAVMMAATAAVVATYHVVENNRKIQAQSEMTEVIAGNLASFALSSGLAYITQDTAIQVGIYPTQMLDSNGHARNVWGGEAIITPTPGTTQSATLVLANVPKRACIKLIQQTASGFHSTAVGNVEVSSNYGKVNMARLTDACNQQQGASIVRLNYLHK